MTRRATPGEASEAARVYDAMERPTPIPRDPAVDRLVDRLVDLNLASRRELEALPGIGADRAQALIEAREAATFRSMAEIAERGVVPVSVLAELDGWATVSISVAGGEQ